MIFILYYIRYHMIFMLYSIILYSIILYYLILYYIILYYMIFMLYYMSKTYFMLCRGNVVPGLWPSFALPDCRLDGCMDPLPIPTGYARRSGHALSTKLSQRESNTNKKSDRCHEKSKYHRYVMRYIYKYIYIYIVCEIFFIRFT